MVFTQSHHDQISRRRSFGFTSATELFVNYLHTKQNRLPFKQKLNQLWKTRLALGRVHTSAKAQQSLLYSFINSSHSTMSGGNKSPFSQCYRKWEQIPGSLSGSKLEVHDIHSGSRLNLHPSSCSVVFVVTLPTNQPTNPKTAGNTDDGSDHVNETLIEPEETFEGVARCSPRSCDKRFLVDMKLKIQTTQPSESPFTHNPRLTSCCPLIFLLCFEPRGENGPVSVNAASQSPTFFYLLYLT